MGIAVRMPADPTGWSVHVVDGDEVVSGPKSSRPESTKIHCTITSELITWVTGGRLRARTAGNSDY